MRLYAEDLCCIFTTSRMPGHVQEALGPKAVSWQKEVEELQPSTAGAVVVPATPRAGDSPAPPPAPIRTQCRPVYQGADKPVDANRPVECGKLSKEAFEVEKKLLGSKIGLCAELAVRCSSC